LLERAVRSCAAYPTVVVCSSSVAEHVRGQHVTQVINDRPELGMATSLRLANERIDATHALVVLPADVALIEASHIAYVLDRAEGVDVTYPERDDGTPGHPVVFSSHARSGIEALPDGDTIRQLRDREDLTRHVLEVDDAWPYQDVDFESDLKAIFPA